MNTHNQPDYIDNSIQIEQCLFENDFDNIAYEPEIVKDDFDANADELFGYSK